MQEASPYSQEGSNCLLTQSTEDLHNKIGGAPAPQAPQQLCPDCLERYCRCQKAAKLQCPKCLELGLPKQPSAFCSQDCFKVRLNPYPEHAALRTTRECSWLWNLSMAVVVARTTSEGPEGVSVQS